MRWPPARAPQESRATPPPPHVPTRRTPHERSPTSRATFRKPPCTSRIVGREGASLHARRRRALRRGKPKGGIGRRDSSCADLSALDVRTQQDRELLPPAMNPDFDLGQRGFEHVRDRIVGETFVLAKIKRRT